MVQAIDLHLDNPNSGFFFQQSSASAQQHLPKFLSVHSLNSSSERNGDVKPLLRERLTVLGPTQPSRIEVSYGPFEAKQSLPAKLVIPLLHFPLENLSIPFDNSEHTLLDITAHVVNTELRRENPVLRVLFHSGKHFHSFTEEDAADKRTEEDHTWEDDPNSKMMETCIALKVESQNEGESPLITTCVPKGLDGVCLASAAVPFHWWKTSTLSPSFPSLSSRVPVATPKPNKAVRNLIELSYTVYETVAGQCAFHRAIHKDKWHKMPGHHHKNSRRSHTTFPPANAILIQSATLIGSLRLLPNMYAPRDLVSSEGTVALSPTLRFVSSAAPLYPQSFLYVTVLLDAASHLSKDEPYAVVVRYLSSPSQESYPKNPHEIKRISNSLNSILVSII